MKFGMGQPVTRKEDVRFLTGRGRYIDDIRPEGLLQAYVLRSAVAHARVSVAGLDAARAAPGVALAWAWDDVKERLAPLAAGMAPPLKGGKSMAPVVQPQLADGVVRHVGQPIAFLVAETLEQAKDAAELIELDYDELPVVIRGVDALAAGAPELHQEAPGNLSYDWEIGDAAATEAAFAAAAHVARAEVLNQRLIVVAMEPRGLVIRFHKETGRWEGWVGSQGAHSMRNGIARALKVPADRLRIHAPDIGGGFGMKIMQHPEYALAALAAEATGRPVKWIADRSESFLSDAQARDLETTIEGAFDAEGTLLAIRSDGVSNLGAYHSTMGPNIHTIFSGMLTGGMYRTPCFHVRVRGAFTNTPPTDAYRGAGRPEVIHCTERMMEAAARGLGMDPVALRRKNLLTPAELPHTAPGGLVFDSLDPAKLIDKAMEVSDWAGFEARAAASAAAGKVRGRAAIYYMERTGGGPDENAEVVITAEGETSIRIGTQTTGQGHETAWAQLLTDNLGLDWDQEIALLPGDSDALPVGGGTGGSRSTIMASRVIRLAAEDIVTKLTPAASEELEAAPADVEFRAADGAFAVAGTDRTAPIKTVVKKAGGVTGFGRVSDTTPTFPNGCHVAEVEIDLETGRTTLAAYAMADDFGRIVNPILAGGQAQGGVVQGVAQAFLEAAAWAPETGQPLTASFMDYAIPRADDLPALEPNFVEDAPCLTNPYGVKGGGESGTVAGIPAAVLAAQDALIRAGAGPIEAPFSPFRVWEALQAR